MRKILISMILLPLILIVGCTNESYIKKEIEKANYCEIDSDCVLISSECPFGCYQAININEKQKVISLLESYKPGSEKCVYGCLYCEKVICVDKRCQEVCE